MNLSRGSPFTCFFRSSGGIQAILVPCLGGNAGLRFGSRSLRSRRLCGLRRLAGAPRLGLLEPLRLELLVGGTNWPILAELLLHVGVADYHVRRNQELD